MLGTGKDWESEAFQKDVASLPDISTLEEYAAMPVSSFGEAMLRGMGWSEEKESVKVHTRLSCQEHFGCFKCAIAAKLRRCPWKSFCCGQIWLGGETSAFSHQGQKPDNFVKHWPFLQDQAKEFVRRAPLLGLGATQSVPQSRKEKRIIKPGETREAKKDLVVYDEKGHIKHTKTAADKLVERVVRGPQVGKQMRVMKGRDAGIRCKVCTIHEQVSSTSSTVKSCPKIVLVWKKQDWTNHILVFPICNLM